MAGNPRVDNTAMLLVLLFFLPWILGIIKSFEGFGVKLEMADLQPMSPQEIDEQRTKLRASFATFGQTQFDLGMVENALGAALLKAGAVKVEREVKIVRPDGGRLFLDAVAHGSAATYLVEVKAGDPRLSATAIPQIERTVEIYMVGRDCEQVIGLLVFADMTPDAVREVVRTPPPRRVVLAVLDSKTSEMQIVYPNRLL